MDLGNIRYVWTMTSGLRAFADHEMASEHVAIETSKNSEIIIIYERGFIVIRDGVTTENRGRPIIAGIGVV